MVTNNIDKLAEDLERQELESQNGAALPQVYEQLLAIYLYNNDLCNAKYLWKRIPVNVKSSTAELGHIWTVAQHMWKRDFPSIYKALNTVVWSETVADIMKHVQDKVRCRAVELIAQAYSSIRLEAVAAMTGLPLDAAGRGCVERGWRLDADTGMVHPTPPPLPATTHISTQHQLYKLTDFVSFLEN